MRELRTCPVEGHIVLINDAINSAVEVDALQSAVAPVATAAADARWQPYEPPWVGIEGSTAVTRLPAVARDGLGAHERLSGALPNVLRLAQERMADLRRDARLQGFALAGEWSNGRISAMDLVALPFETRSSAPARWRDAEIGGPRCLLVDSSAVVLLAWAPRTPLECWILPREGRAGFEAHKVQSLAVLTERVLRRLEGALPGVTIDVVLVDGEPWRLELRPRVRSEGLFPIATGIPAHGTFPERALLYLCDFNLQDRPSTP
jgi:hypothetical protein